MLDRFGQLPPPAVALIELRRLRLLGTAAPGSAARVENLKVMHQVSEVTLARPLAPLELKTFMLGLRTPVEFFSGREFGFRLRGEGLALLNLTREALEVLALAALAGETAAGGSAPVGAGAVRSRA